MRNKGHISVLKFQSVFTHFPLSELAPFALLKSKTRKILSFRQKHDIHMDERKNAQKLTKGIYKTEEEKKKKRKEKTEMPSY